MKLFATPIDRTFIRFSYRPDHLSGAVRPSQTLSPTHQYWNTHLDQLFDLWRRGLDTAQIALRCGLSEGETYNVMSSIWDWNVKERRKGLTYKPSR